MKTVIRLIACFVASALVGCAESSVPSTFPDLEGYVVLATMGKNKLITLYPSAEIVCVENGIPNMPYTGHSSAFSCWNVDMAPKKIQELIGNYNKK